jgi:hypothetical protein
MLITLSLEDLQYCLELMNHYYKTCAKDKLMQNKKMNNSR